MYKFSNKLLPSSFNNMFTTNSDNHNYDTRFASDFEYPNDKLAFGNKSIRYQGAKTWNNIPAHVKVSRSLSCFKCNYKNNFISCYKLIDN